MADELKGFKSRWVYETYLTLIQELNDDELDYFINELDIEAEDRYYKRKAKDD